MVIIILDDKKCLLTVSCQMLASNKQMMLSPTCHCPITICSQIKQIFLPADDNLY